MVRRSFAFGLQILALGMAISLVPFAPAQHNAVNSNDRSVSTIITDLRGFEMPIFDRDRDQIEASYRSVYLIERNSALEKKAALIGELFRAAPDYNGMGRLLAQRWFILSTPLHRADEALAEIEQTLKQKQLPPEIIREAWYARAEAHIAIAQRDKNTTVLKDVSAAISAVVESYPRDQRNIKLLATLATQFTMNALRKKAIYEQMILDYPDSASAKYWPGKLHQIAGIGKPFVLEFTDALTEDAVSINEMQGKIIVIHFWASWSGPAAAEISKHQKLRARYQAKGIEFIGVSLDQPTSQGGLERLKAFCKANAITWPQFYQGNGWNSKFSVAWGVDTIPTTFLIDAEGKLISTDAGNELAEWLELLLGESMAAAKE